MFFGNSDINGDGTIDTNDPDKMVEGEIMPEEEEEEDGFESKYTSKYGYGYNLFYSK